MFTGFISSGGTASVWSHDLHSDNFYLLGGWGVDFSVAPLTFLSVTIESES